MPCQLISMFIIGKGRRRKPPLNFWRCSALLGAQTISVTSFGRSRPQTVSIRDVRLAHSSSSGCRPFTRTAWHGGDPHEYDPTSGELSLNLGDGRGEAAAG